MLVNFFMWHILLIPLIHSSNVTVNKTEHDSDKILNVKEPPKRVNNTQGIMVSEGGSILHDAPVISLPKSNLTLELLNIDNETGKTKEKPVQARKGVGSPLDIPRTPNKPMVDNDIQSNDLKEKFNAALKSLKNATVATSVVANTTSSNETTNHNTTKVESPKKPLKVSYDTLAKLEQKFDTKIPFVKSSSKTIVNDQMPSPNQETIPKTYSMASKHPGMVTPIVITILVVPMFAVLGYMAVKRGQEAWKNRHYKRMDFLLDGMYND